MARSSDRLYRRLASAHTLLLLLLASSTLSACAEAMQEPSTHAQADEVELLEDPAQIHALLSGGVYRDWSCESEVLPALLDRGRRVCLHASINPEDSPAGAIAVREMYDRSGPGAELVGWSFLQKVQRSEQPARDWFFYETFSPDDPDGHSVAERDAAGCRACHASAPDIIQSTRPLP